MSVLTLKLIAEPTERLNLTGISPTKLEGMSPDEISKINLGSNADPVLLGDWFHVTGSSADTITIDGGSTRLDFIGASLDKGTIIIDGNVGAYAGHKMTSGRLDIRGNAGQYFASSLIDGLVTVAGNVGDHLGAPKRGERDGIQGGNIIVHGTIGDFAGERMRRGTLIARGNIGSSAGARMMGGTIWATRGFGASPGVQMRRGMLITPTVGSLLPTFVDCGHHDLSILAIMHRHLKQTLGELAPSLSTATVQKFAGDMASLGKGELLVTG